MNNINKLLLILLLGGIVSCKSNRINLKNDESIDDSNLNYVPDAETAKKVAEAIWIPIYGHGILTQKPFVAELKNGIWYVKGTLVGFPNEKIVGGVAYIEIQKNDCKILKVTHGK